jgi:VanZ family protein
VLLLLVSWLAFAPAAPVVEPFVHLDKLKHVLAFAALSVVAGVGWWHARAAALWLTLGLLAFGVFIELVQSRIPTRDASAADVVADTLGIVLGLVLVRTLSGRKPPPKI